MSENLNTQQNKAVESIFGPLLVLAGAGAGKTKTVASRIANIIKNGFSPEEILAITFTNKAAKEMRERVERQIDKDLAFNRTGSNNERPFVSTFHALGVHILRENHAALDLPKFFTIFDRGDSKQAIKEATKKAGLDPKQFDAGKILSVISRSKGDSITLDEYESLPGDYFKDIVADIWRHYEQILKKEKALDFDDLLLRTLGLLKKPELLNHYQNIWKFIHVDEYQDTNGVQYEIIKLLASKNKNICVVGDIDQNIYSWRGARLKNILDFEKEYPEAKIILLEENYRSTKTILKVANHIIKKNKFRKEKNLFTNNPEGEPISLFEGFDEVSEAEFIASKCSDLITKKVSPDEIAVLFRANFQSRVLEEAFLSYGVSYQLIGTRFFERREVKDVLSYLRASLSNENYSDIKRIINVPSRGIGKISLLKIFESKTESLPKKARDSYKDFLTILQKINEFSKKEKPSETIKYILKHSGIEEELSNRTEDGEERLENVRELVTLATRYDYLGPEKGIEQMLTDAALQSDQDELSNKKEGVKLMTVHAAKGLEFEYVFITGLEENLFPHKHIEEDTISDEEDEEERRLFYVALTRAKKKIFLSFAELRTLYGQKQVNVPSEFIYDIPDDLIIKEEGTFGLLGRTFKTINF